jgi:hypothetical protein
VQYVARRLSILHLGIFALLVLDFRSHKWSDQQSTRLHRLRVLFLAIYTVDPQWYAQQEQRPA